MLLKPVSPRKQIALQAKLDHIASLEDQFKLLLEHFKLKDKSIFMMHLKSLYLR